jgi:ribokinase
MDLIVQCREAPRRGETLHGEGFQMVAGGKGANQAVACARLGAQTAMVGRVGKDEFGQSLRRGLAAEGVEVEGVAWDEWAATGVALILLEQDGSNRIVIVGGANAELGKEDMARARAELGNCDAVLMQLETPLPVVKEIAAAARAEGVLSVLDAGAATPEAAALGLPALVDVVSPNEPEAEALTDVSIRSLSDASAAAQALREMGAREVVIKLGRAGAWWAGSEGEAHFPAFPIDPVDTTAAGDAFTACLTVSLAQGLPMAQALRRSNAAGALACLKLGAQPSMPTAAEIEEFLSQP